MSPVADRSTSAPYVPADIEARWRSVWRKANVFATPAPRAGRRDVYVYPAQPFTSGSAHMGHVRSYTIADAYARFRRARGDGVLFVIGFDAFGLPAELSAIEHGESPREWVEHCRARMTEQFQRLGYSFDWSRSFVTCDDDNYRWTQWLFLTLLDSGMIYRAPAQVDWCDGCATVLPGLQIEGDRCARCGGPVRLAELSQWHLRVAAYAEEAERRLDGLTRWSKLALASQRGAIGRVHGVELDVRDAVDGTALTVFTPHADAIGGAAFVALSPHHPDLPRWTGEPEIAAALRDLPVTQRRRSDRKPEALPVVPTNRRVRLEGADRELPVVVTPAVDSRFGPTAVLGIPAADRTDAAIADRLAYSAAEVGGGPPAPVRPALRRRVRDFVLSRQRSWGSPIPVIHCDGCGVVPVPFEDLPVRLPDDLVVTGRGRPLADHPTFARCSCPRCGAAARRETDTLDCHSDALWVWMAPCVPREERSRGVLDHPELLRWLPVDLVVFGADLGDVMYDLRVGAKALRDAGVLVELADGEPFSAVLMHEMVRMDGRKMSKHVGNVVDPEKLIADYGADTLRLAALYAAAPARPVSWTDDPLRQCHQFLHRLWRYCAERREICLDVACDVELDVADPLRRRLALWCQTAAAKVTAELEARKMHQATRDVMHLLERLDRFEERVVATRGELDERDREAVAYAIRLLVRLLAPFAPHVAEEIWARTGGEAMLATEPWPVVEAR